MKRGRFLRPLLLASILLFALFTRIYRLSVIPPGLFMDEAVSGLCALDVKEGTNRPIYFERIWGVDALYPYLTALNFLIFPPSAFSIRLVSAISGVLTVLFLFLLMKQLFNYEAALLSALFLSFSRWHITFSRTGFQGVSLSPLMNVISFYLLFTALKGRNIPLFILSGFSFGLGLYSHFSFRVVPFVLLIFLSYKAFEKGFLKENIGRCLSLLTGLAITILPLSVYFAGRLDLLMERQKMVYVSNIAGILSNIWKVALMFGFSGDPNPRHNIPHEPMLPFPFFLLFTGGLLLALFRGVRSRREEYIFLLIWFFLLITPSIFSTEAPHASRNLAAVLPACAFAGLFFFEASSLTGVWQKALIPLLSLLVLYSGYRDVRSYFMVWPEDGRVLEAFDREYIEIYREIDGASSEGIPGIPLSLCLYPTVTFLLRAGGTGFFTITDHSSLVSPSPVDRDLLFFLPTDKGEKLIGDLVRFVYPGGEEEGVIAGGRGPFILYKVRKGMVKGGLPSNNREMIDTIFREVNSASEDLPWLRGEVSYCRGMGKIPVKRNQ